MSFVTKNVKTSTEFKIPLPSGSYLRITMYDSSPEEDIAFVERLAKLALESVWKGDAPSPDQEVD